MDQLCDRPRKVLLTHRQCQLLQVILNVDGQVRSRAIEPGPPTGKEPSQAKALVELCTERSLHGVVELLPEGVFTEVQREESILHIDFDAKDRAAIHLVWQAPHRADREARLCQKVIGIHFLVSGHVFASSISLQVVNSEGTVRRMRLVIEGRLHHASMGDQNEVQIAPGILEGTQPFLQPHGSALKGTFSFLWMRPVMPPFSSVHAMFFTIGFNIFPIEQTEFRRSRQFLHCGAAVAAPHVRMHERLFCAQRVYQRGQFLAAFVFAIQQLLRDNPQGRLQRSGEGGNHRQLDLVKDARLSQLLGNCSGLCLPGLVDLCVFAHEATYACIGVV
mmetsp:Transcript_65758/g.133598  ORF Transcript_65758/g.133598 Transcript_65758/m.133598 type:complete len:333 (+) Transcript_65758:191-1189(+)